MLEHGLIDPNGTETTAGILMLSAEFGIFSLVVGTTVFTAAMVKSFASVHGVVDTGVGILELLNCHIAIQSPGGAVLQCNVEYQYTLKASINNETTTPSDVPYRRLYQLWVRIVSIV